MKKLLENKIVVVGLGYVGLPLCVALGKYFKTIGFDKNPKRIEELKNSFDYTKELSSKDLKNTKNIKFSSNMKDLENCNIYIITVPTPINRYKEPDVSYLKSATELVAKYIKKNSIVVYESTVYPGATEEFCVPILSKISKLKYTKDFSVGYSPERINPGDKNHKISDIIKVVSASDKKTLKIIKDVYSLIIAAGVYPVESIKIAEAAKVIENIQRDVNVALINEFSIIFNKLNINTYKVLDAAKTKWNFLNFNPGLVGGHCIGVDPYYLTYKSLKLGYNPELILSGRDINERMASYVTKLFVNKLNLKFGNKKFLKVLVLGITFKENCPDTRNSKIFNIIKKLNLKKINVDVFDPYISSKSFSNQNKFKILDTIQNNNYDGILIAVAHNEFKKFGIKKIKALGNSDSVVFDIKNQFKNSKYVDLTL